MELLKTILLMPSREWFVILLISALVSSKYRRATLQAVTLINFSIVINPFLKYYFKVPSPPHLIDKNPWAFPSGHTQAFATFYGYLAIKAPGIRAILYIFIAAIGPSTVLTGYHTWVDVAGGYAVALIIIILTHVLNKVISFQKICVVLLFLAGVSTYFLPQIRPHQWPCFAMLIAFTLFKDKEIKTLKNFDWAVFILTLIGIGICYKAVDLFGNTIIAQSISMFILSIWILQVSVYISSSICPRIS